MRAHWVKDLIEQDSYVLKDQSLHHLVNVVRIEAGEELMLLSGAGLMVVTTVESISKRELKLKFKEKIEDQRSFNFDLALGMPKRDALELCLKQATELGFRNIYLVRSDFSQMRFPEADRVEKLLVSALEQSNAPYLPQVQEADWKSIPWDQYSEAILMDSQTKIQAPKKTSDSLSPRLLIIGPEGGFSSGELQFLHSKERVRVVNLPTPILRTPTALAVGAGLMIESLLK
ncbi:MAG: 16S rRNA (uracil(1498)-N(3))-methyltransferase [Bacteriovoracaceae bacterium]|nr:16S rRNA (uracil(1498)-N(3))-methyltransferase [Bacteriovoracaceae bacterium]